MNIIVTVPNTTLWSDYQKELVKAEDGALLNFKVTTFPKKTKIGERCYVCYNGYVLGYMLICGFKDHEFVCTTTGKRWKGKCIQRTGTFHYIDPVECKGFRGFRYWRENDKLQNTS